ncbi:uncharacterized protein LOC106172212 [Lingula anatina]|uniref:Uncharacterized protein LOC106172212 n=1 Tax=Lingula anatina TaxID=7574 RepID=A0A1S3JEH8_LINAN|nr:uncharacterized protein LOC106172212 [Lingula anatina]|eukprot:XP_013408294.1 uncharacterized protein LOC106172212 [Lingula anatina]
MADLYLVQAGIVLVSVVLAVISVTQDTWVLGFGHSTPADQDFIYQKFGPWGVCFTGCVQCDRQYTLECITVDMNTLVFTYLKLVQFFEVLSLGFLAVGGAMCLMPCKFHAQRKFGRIQVFFIFLGTVFQLSAVAVFGYNAHANSAPPEGADIYRVYGWPFYVIIVVLLILAMVSILAVITEYKQTQLIQEPNETETRLGYHAFYSSDDAVGAVV